MAKMLNVISMAEASLNVAFGDEAYSSSVSGPRPIPALPDDCERSSWEANLDAAHVPGCSQIANPFGLGLAEAKERAHLRLRKCRQRWWEVELVWNEAEVGWVLQR